MRRMSLPWPYIPHVWADEDLLRLDTPERCPEMLEIRPQGRLPLVDDGARAHGLPGSHAPANLPELLIELGELRPVSPLGVRPLRRLEPAEALLGVEQEAQLSVLAVVHDIDACPELLPDDLDDGGAHSRGKGLLVVCLAALLRQEQLSQVGGGVRSSPCVW
jgi:hypothetical protein